MGEDDKPKADAILKAHTDLWIHHNTLMYGRYQTLAILQAGFFATANYVRLNPSLVLLTLSLAVALTLLLFIYIGSDQDIRDEHREALIRYGVHPSPRGTSRWEKIYLYGGRTVVPSIGFGGCVLADMLAAVAVFRAI